MSKSDQNLDQGDLSSAQAAQTLLMDDFGLFDDWTEKYRHIIDLGKALPELSDDEKTDENRVFGCQSMVWFVIDRDEDDRLHLRATSDAMIVRGLIAMLLSVYAGRKASTIAALEPEFIDKLDLGAHLSPTRNNGLLSMVKRLKSEASGD